MHIGHVISIFRSASFRTEQNLGSPQALAASNDATHSEFDRKALLSSLLESVNYKYVIIEKRIQARGIEERKFTSGISGACLMHASFLSAIYTCALVSHSAYT